MNSEVLSPTAGTLRKAVPGMILFLNGCALLGSFSRAGSSAFIMGLPIIGYFVVRLIIPRFRAHQSWALAGGATLASAVLLGTGTGQPESRPASSEATRQVQMSEAVPSQGSRSRERGDAVAPPERPVPTVAHGDGQAHYRAAMHHLHQTGNTTEALHHLEQAQTAFPVGSLWHRRTQQLLLQVKGKQP